LWLATITVDRSGPAAAEGILNDCRHSAIMIGDARLWAALHAYSALIEARRGLLRSASSHIRLAHEHLRRAPNVWLQATLEFTRTNIAVLKSDFRSALVLGRRATSLAKESGSASCLRTCYANLGFIHYSLGQFEEAVASCSMALEVLPSN